MAKIPYDVRNVVTNPAGVTMLSDVTEEKVSWLWRGWLAYGKVALLDGDPGLGKSTLALDLAARVTNGDVMPSNAAPVEPDTVLVISAEDDVADTIKPRLRAAGADMERVGTLSLRHDDTGEPLPFSVPEDMKRLRLAVDQVEARFVIIDPVAAYLSEKIQSHNDASVRKAMAPLATLAQETHAAILLLRHLNKDLSTNKALYRGGGSIAFAGAARSVMVAAADPEDEERRVLAQTKGNLSRGKTASLSWKVIPWQEDFDIPRIKWLGASELSADELLASPDGRKLAPARKEAETFLREALRNGPVRSDALQKEARSLGIADRTLKRARKETGVLRCPERRPDGKQVRHWWTYLPGQENHLPADCEPQ
jgi:hypothetical protein